MSLDQLITHYETMFLNLPRQLGVGLPHCLFDWQVVYGRLFWANVYPVLHSKRMVLPIMLCEPTTMPLLGADGSGQSAPTSICGIASKPNLKL